MGTRKYASGLALALCATAALAQVENITVLVPDSSTMYRHGQDVEADWTPALSDGRTIRAELYHDGVYVGEYHPLTDNDGHLARAACPEEWGWGINYQVKVIHEPTGDYGWSEPFVIVGGTGGQGGVTVTTPDSSTHYYHGGEAEARWEPALNDGRTILTRIFKGGEYVGIYHDPTPNDGDLARAAIPETWGTGVDFQVQVIHMPTGDYGWSEEFTISGDGADVIDVLWPMSYTKYRFGEVAICDWLPALNDGRTIRVDLYKGNTLVGEYHPATDNDGHCERVSVPCEWGSGSDFRVRVVHEPTGDFGWSDYFTILNPADTNEDGVVNTLDVLVYLNAWSAGCP